MRQESIIVQRTEQLPEEVGPAHDVICGACERRVGYADVPGLVIECLTCASARTWVVDVNIPRRGGFKRWERSARMTERAAKRYASRLGSLGYQTHAVPHTTPAPAPQTQRPRQRRRAS